MELAPIPTFGARADLWDLARRITAGSVVGMDQRAGALNKG